MDVGAETAAASSGGDSFTAILMVGVIWVAFFSWLAVTGWARQRRREREAFYRNETEKRLLDKGEATAEQILRVRNQEERVRWLQRREGLKLGGLITVAVGVGIIVALPMIEAGEQTLAGAGAMGPWPARRCAQIGSKYVVDYGRPPASRPGTCCRCQPTKPGSCTSPTCQ